MDLIYRNITRFSDLDTQRHVNNIIYENLAESSRMELLFRSGISLSDMLDKGITFRPVKCFVSFLEQQSMNTEMIVHTNLYRMENGHLHYSSRLKSSQSEKDACLIEFIYEPNICGKKINLFPETSESAPYLFEEIKPFTGSCKQVKFEYHTRYAERNILGSLPGSSYWRMLEEARWDFVNKLGITFEFIRRENTTMFYMGGTFDFKNEIIAGKKYQIRTWVDSIDKIWVYMRQDVSPWKSEDVVMSMRGRFLIVSVDKARPKKADEKLIKIYSKHTEFK